MKVTLYHASHCDNLDSIQEKGLNPRTIDDADKIIDSILAEYGFTRGDLPKWRWQYPLQRLRDTAGKVFVTSDPIYALQNCLAGYEAEAELRTNIRGFKAHKRTGGYSTEQVLVKKGLKPLCGICSVELDTTDAIFNSVRERYTELTPEQKASRKVTDDEEYIAYVLSLGMTLVSEEPIPPDKIKGCGCVGSSYHPFDDEEKLRKRREEVLSELKPNLLRED